MCMLAKFPGKFQGGEEVQYSDPSQVFRFCKSLSEWVVLRHDYLPHDFTIYMYKNNPNTIKR